ncbi:MAG: hypothetical protein MRERC_1c140 [Mycoplasmataceae bacterium RC_NB112A]|nr:MAG: hypothetical protein MRERC_1c140 [Mycoplasmataceae bacterium RC_NB112A]
MLGRSIIPDTIGNLKKFARAFFLRPITLRLEADDKVQEVAVAKVENLVNKSLEELIEVVKILQKKEDKLNREISIAYFYIGKIFYERIEEFFIEKNLDGKEKNRKILGSFRHVKELDFGNDRMSIIEIKEKLKVDDSKISRFFGLTLKIYLIYKIFDSLENQIRKTE